MDAKETLKLISKQWCSLNDLMKLAEVGKNNAVKLRREIRNELLEKGYTLPNTGLPMIEKMMSMRLEKFFNYIILNLLLVIIQILISA